MDPLAELPGPEEWQALLAREELRRARTGELMSVAILDVDGLRELNARHGAGLGSDVLRLAVGTLRASLRSVDELCRHGADEFAVLLHGTDGRSASVWADRFEDALYDASAGMEAGPVTCSVGIADTSGDRSLLVAADKARRRMEVIQVMRKLRRARETGTDPGGLP